MDAGKNPAARIHAGPIAQQTVRRDERAEDPLRQRAAPLNLAVPEYAFLSDTKVKIG